MGSEVGRATEIGLPLNGYPFAVENPLFQSEDLFFVLGQTIIQRVERREKQRGQARIWDL